MSLIYQYDGSFEGLLCAIRHAMKNREIPLAIQPPEESQISFFPTIPIQTDFDQAAKTGAWIKKQLGEEGWRQFRLGFLTCLEEKERILLELAVLSRRYGGQIFNMLTHPTVHAFSAAVRNLEHEAHLLSGFIRFTEYGGVLAAEINPKNYVLPAIAEHFCRRFPEEQFLILDRAHFLALQYKPHEPVILPIRSDAVLPAVSAREKEYQDLWKLFYKTIAIPERENPRLRMNNMSRRYWKNILEMQNNR